MQSTMDNGYDRRRISSFDYHQKRCFKSIQNPCEIRDTREQQSSISGTQYFQVVNLAIVSSTQGKLPDSITYSKVLQVLVGEPLAWYI